MLWLCFWLGMGMAVRGCRLLRSGVMAMCCFHCWRRVRMFVCLGVAVPMGVGMPALQRILARGFQYMSRKRRT